METIVINSINEIDQYIDQLKQIKVWLCHPAIGKSWLCFYDDRFFDLDDYTYQLKRSNIKDSEYESRLIEKLQEKLNAGYIVLDNPRSFVVDFLKKHELPFVNLRANPVYYHAFIQRMHRRKSKEETIQRVKLYFKHNYYNDFDLNAKFTIVMQSDEYLSDYLWRVFDSKYIKCHKFNPEQYKIAFVGLSSLFIDNHKLSKFTIKSIQQLKNKVKIVLFTGQSFAGKEYKKIKPYLKKLGLNHVDEIVIHNNGGLIMKGNGEVVTSITEAPSILKAIQTVTDLCHEKMENVIAIGEFANTPEILKAVGCGIAVVNRDNEDAKRAAKYLTDSRKEDGAAKALVKIFG